MAGAAVELEEFRAWAAQAAQKVNGNRFVGPAIKQCSLLLVKAVKENFEKQRSPTGQPWPTIKGRVRGGSKALRDTGRLMASITAQVKDDQLIVGSNLNYAAIHQWGGSITPKKGKALAIPQTVQALRAGSPRKMPGLVLIWKKGARSGGLYSGKGRSKKLQFLLVSRVVIPARPYLGWSEDTIRECEEILGDHFDETLGGRRGGRRTSP